MKLRLYDDIVKSAIYALQEKNLYLSGICCFLINRMFSFHQLWENGKKLIHRFLWILVFLSFVLFIYLLNLVWVFLSCFLSKSFPVFSFPVSLSLTALSLKWCSSQYSATIIFLQSSKMTTLQVFVFSLDHIPSPLKSVKTSGNGLMTCT